MTFTKYACWQADRVAVVMNPDAEHVADDVFLAVHTEHDLIMVDPGVRGGDQQWSARHRWTLPPDEFLREFLSPSRRQVHTAVLGEAGSGKSHFIRWLALNMPRRENLIVLSIPKTGTNLRGVLERIIAILPADHAEEYLEALNAAGYSGATREQRRERLLSEIALSIGALQPEPEGVNAEAEEWLIGGLPMLFNDPHFRSRMGAPGGIIEQLVDHISEAPHVYERREERRAFRRDDLPLTGIEIVNLSREAREFLVYLLDNQELVPLAVDIINRSLNAAIAGVLNFRGDRLLELMLDVRRYLRRVGKALILLIEDFARLQGVDAALLQALIEAPSEGPEGLCELRWAMAVTRGYYEQLPDTVKSRMDFLIDMDLPTEGDLAVLGADSILAFAKQYLNTVRLDTAELAGWYEAHAVDAERTPTPNPCDACRYRDECHAAFGSVEGVGLYPFNQAALNTMAARRDPNIRERFNPRRFIKGVLAEVLGAHRRELEVGEFPGDRLLRVMGGSRLAPALEDELKRANPVDFRRQLAVLELWGEPGRPVRLPEGIYTAFALKPPLLPRGEEASARAEPARGRATIPDLAGAERVDSIVHAVRRWAQGDSMPEQAATLLREYIYAALENYTDWDDAGLERKSFMQRVGGANVPFRARNIVFLRQQTQAPPSGVLLQLPHNPGDEDELRRTAIALEALRQFHLRKAWDFPGAFNGLVAVGECLTQWSAALLNEFRRWPGGPKREVVGAAVEVLAVGAALGGRLSGGRTTAIDALNALFEPWPELAPEQAANEWRALYDAIRQRVDDLRGVLRAWAFATKGGQAGAMLDPSAILPPLKTILRDWTPAVGLASEATLREPYQTLARLHERVRSHLDEAALAEYNRRMDWLDEVRRYMDTNTSRADVAEEAQRLRDAIATQGIAVRPGLLNAYDETLAAFKAVQLDAAIRAAEQLREVRNPRAELPRLPLDRAAAAMTAASRFFSAADSLLAEAGAAIATKRAALDTQVGEHLQRDLETIERSLVEIERALGVIGGGAC
jgi:hypothetical protein